ncbi:MAG: hypothetical protein NTU78_18335 [Alphaproteobacteria bacterium]|nr:hypothetical protein [Alphaproteobacteria bacterium]
MCSAVTAPGTTARVTSAFDCGFGSLSRFYEAFEQRFQTSPAAFRQRFNRAVA